MMRECAFDDRDLAVKKRDLAQAALHGGLLVEGQALLVKPSAAALTEQIPDRRALDQVARQDRKRARPRLKRHVIVGPEALSEQLELLTRRRDPARRTDPPILTIATSHAR
jgi:hypothetical protein